MWVTASEIITLTGMPMTAQGVHYKARSCGWERRRAEGVKGKVFEFNLNSLPITARAEYLKKQGKIEVNGKSIDIPTPKKSDRYCPELLWREYDRATDKQKASAKLRVEAVHAVEALIATNVPVVDALSSAADAFCVTAAALRKWYYKSRNYDRSDYLAALVSEYKSSTNRHAEITPKAWDFFLADYLRLERPSLRTCYHRLTAAAKAHGWIVPSCKSIERKVKRDIPETQLILLREGEHALMRMYPAQQRTVSGLQAMEWINGDGYQHNVFVKWHNGQVLRPKTWIWQDIRTRKILAYRCDVSENSDSIRLALADVIERYGVPRELTIDNTRAVANKWLTGGVPNRYRFKVKEDDPLGIIPSLGINLHWTSVIFGKGHGQAKPIERAFSHGGLGELVDKHPLLAGAYTGPNPMEKPDNYNSRAVSVDDFMTALHAGIEMFNSIEGRNTEICAGQLSFNQAFERDYKNAVVKRATKEQQALLLLPAEAVTLGQDGTFALQCGGSLYSRKNRYGNDALIGYRAKKIVVRFDPQRLHESVLVYSLDGQFICNASCIDAVAFGDSSAAREHSRARTQMVKSTKQAAKARKQMNALEIAALMPEIEEPETPDNKIVEMLIPRGNTVTKQFVNAETGEVLDFESAFSNAVDQMYEEKMGSRI